MIKRILVPIDGSEHADKALDCTLDLAEKYKADIVVLNVVTVTPRAWILDPTVASPVWIDTYSNDVRAGSEKMLTEALKKAKKVKPELNISKKIVEGRPANKIIEAAKEGNFDIIVMGSRGLGDIKEFFLGSVSDRVADKAECPVLIVK